MIRPLRDRVSCGEVAAFLDPELPLELLADPVGSWFVNGCHALLVNLLRARGVSIDVWGLEERIRTGISIVCYWGASGGTDIWATMSADERAAFIFIDQHLHLPP